MQGLMMDYPLTLQHFFDRAVRIFPRKEIVTQTDNRLHRYTFGEWISSVELESLIMGHPKVLESCVIGIPHPRWDERPLAFVVAKPDYAGQITKEEIIEYLRPHVAKWWLPDDVVFVDAIPKTSVGKFDKKVLRSKHEMYSTSQG